jgi:hypothetical protein
MCLNLSDNILHMAIQKTKHVTAGGWRTLESGWNVKFWMTFFMPKGAQIKVRNGGGWPFGWDSQKQTLDGINVKILKVEGSSIVYSRVQVYVQHEVDITYIYYPGPYDGLMIPSSGNLPVEH